MPFPVRGTGLAAWALRVSFPNATGKWSRLPPGGPLSVLQVPLQPLVLLTQLFPLALQTFGPLAPLLVLFPQSLILAASAPPLFANGGDRALQVLDDRQRMEGLRAQ